jgi:hypothetical protein
MTTYYLLHATNEDYTQFYELKTAGISDYEVRVQFPGVFFSLITKDNFETEVLFDKKYYLLFSVELLKQKNYHINIRDMNGIISEHNTLFYWQLNEVHDRIKADIKINKRTMNEVVFHDNISMTHLCYVIENKFDGNLKNILPKESLINKKDIAKINTDLLPCYCYYNDYFYTGLNPPPKSSPEWISKMNLVYDIDLTNDKEYYDHVKYIYKNRDKQRLNYLFT